MKKRTRRLGATETFSVSVDSETKRALKALAKSEFGGNLSALVTDLAEDARRRLAAIAYLRRHKLPVPAQADAESIQATIDREALAWKSRKRRSRAA
jgi:hypothetical protein